MTHTSALSPALTEKVLAYLGVTPGAPDCDLLARLLAGYVRTVPWESASRIARRARVADTEACPRWPEEFWESAIALGTGGTCFESNLAFSSLLWSLGYRGYLTINDMKQTRGCHTATVVELEGERWLADAGFPVYVPLRLDHTAPVRRTSAFHTYTLTPQSSGRIDLTRDRHPVTYCFTLNDEPVPDAAYRAATTADYGPGGLFLDRVIIHKVIEGAPWRYTNEGHPPCFESYPDGECFFHPIAGDVARAISERFGIDEETVRTALEAAPGQKK
jgi:arylamine N-acetyltransferase